MSEVRSQEMIAALFVETDGAYFGLDNIDHQRLSCVECEPGGPRETRRER